MSSSLSGWTDLIRFRMFWFCLSLDNPSGFGCYFFNWSLRIIAIDLLSPPLFVPLFSYGAVLWFSKFWEVLGRLTLTWNGGLLSLLSSITKACPDSICWLGWLGTDGIAFRGESTFWTETVPVGATFSSSLFSGVDFEFDSAFGVSSLLDLDFCLGSSARGMDALPCNCISSDAPWEWSDS